MTEKEQIAGRHADAVVDIACRTTSDDDPFTDEQYEHIKAQFTLAIDDAIARLVSKMENWE